MNYGTYGNPLGLIPQISRELGQVQVTSAFTTTSSSAVDVTGMTVTVLVGLRPIKVTAYVPLADLSAGTNSRANIVIAEDGTAVQVGYAWSTAAGQGNAFVMVARLAPAAGIHTYKLQMFRDTGSGTVRVFATTGQPMILLVEEL